jgi:hypothetical protein
MTLQEIVRHRLHIQQLAKPSLTTAADVVAWMGAVQGQDFFGALWSIGQRMKKAVEADIEKAIDDKAIVRTWPMRGTLHFVSPRDIRWMLKYLTPRVISRSAGQFRKTGLGKKDFTKSGKLFEKVLEGGKQLTRDELYKELNRAKIPTTDVRGLHLLGYWAQKGLICFGPRRGKQQTFTLIDEYLPAAPMLEKDEALGELALRYFKSHGPAAIEDFMWWAGLTKADALEGLSLIKSQLAEESVNGKSYWLTPYSSVPKINAATAYLLPTYDEYGIAYKDRSAIVNIDDLRKVNGFFTSAIFLNGRGVGLWRRTLEKDEVVIGTRSFSKFTTEQKRSIEKAAKKYGRFLGLDCKVKF